MNCPRCNLLMEKVYYYGDYFQCDNCQLYRDDHMIRFLIDSKYSIIITNKTFIYNRVSDVKKELDFRINPNISAEQLERYLTLL
jgi:hypothetical protein